MEKCSRNKAHTQSQNTVIQKLTNVNKVCLRVGEE